MLLEGRVPKTAVATTADTEDFALPLVEIAQ